MTYTVSITSQGQISIPAKLRYKLGLRKRGKALISEHDGKIIIESVNDLLLLQGSLRTKIRISPKQTREEFEKHLARHAVGLEK